MKYTGTVFRLDQTEQQALAFEQAAGVCRLIYNIALEQRSTWWRQYKANTGSTLNYVAQARMLKELRREFDFIKNVSQTSQTKTLEELDNAFQRFFVGSAQFPQFRQKRMGARFPFSGREIQIRNLNAKWGSLRLPKIGWVKFRRTRDLVGKICSGTIQKDSKGWTVSFKCAVADNQSEISSRAVGIDRGVTVPLMLSDGTKYILPESIAVLDKKYKKAQRTISRQKRGSRRYAKARMRAANIKARQARVRKDWAHRATTEIARNYGTVVIERLRTSKMTKSAKGSLEVPGKNVAQKSGLNQAILNVGWFQIETMLSYKVGKLIKVNPAYSSQTCACCGAVDKRSRQSQAVFVCTTCGHRDNADRNAAIVILNRGNTAVLDVEGYGSVPCEASTPEREPTLV